MRGRGYRFWDAKRNCYAPDDDFWITYKSEWATYLCSKYASYKGSDIIAEQSTGLPDRNGKEIYEGDIVQGGDDIMLVVWSPRYASFGLKKEGWAFLHYFQEAVTPEQCTVIGNIHENPELLK